MDDYGGPLHKPYPVCRPGGSVAATQRPNKEIRKSRPREFVTRTRNIRPKGKDTPHTHATHRHTSPRQTKENTKRTPVPGARGPLPSGFLLLSHHSRRCHRPFLLFLVAVPILLHWRRRPSHVGGSQEVEHRRAAPLIRQEVTHSLLPLSLPRRLLDPRPQLGLLVFPPRAVLEEVVARLLHTTVVIRVAPTVVVRSVVSLQRSSTSARSSSGSSCTRESRFCSLSPIPSVSFSLQTAPERFA